MVLSVFMVPFPTCCIKPILVFLSIFLLILLLLFLISLLAVSVLLSILACVCYSALLAVGSGFAITQTKFFDR